MCDDNSCPICMDMMDTTKNCIITECGHRFHASCLMQNVVHNGFGCPYCRTEMAKDDEDDDDEDEDEDASYSTESTEIVDDVEPYSNQSLVGFRFLFRMNSSDEDQDNDDDDEDDDDLDRPNPDIGYVIQKFREKYQYEDLVKIICLDYDFRMCDDNSAPNMDQAFDYIDQISNSYNRSEPQITEVVA